MVRLSLDDDPDEKGIWRHLFSEEPELQRLLTTVKDQYKGKRGSKNLIIFDESILCIWDNQDQKLVCCSILDDRVKSVQFLTPTNPPIFDVDNLILSIDGRLLALQGSHGISVMEVPKKWGSHNAFEGGKNPILCRSLPLAERFFVCNQQISLLEARWHPGSLTDSLLLVLTDDDCLRVFDVKKPQNSLKEIRLSGPLPEPSASRYAVPLGQAGVSFDFGPPVPKSQVVGSRRLDQSKMSSASSIDEDVLLWPVFVLRGNGDVLLTHIDSNGMFNSRKILGPLTMRPPAEDNYGVDASSLICLETCPPLLVIATSSMMLYHCIALSTQSNQDSDLIRTNTPSPDPVNNSPPPPPPRSPLDDLGENGNIKSIEGKVKFSGLSSKASGNQSSLQPFNEPTLYVLESLELISSLTSNTDQFLSASSLRLQKSNSNPQIYSCSHEAGIHIVNVPFINQLKLNHLLGDDLEASIIEYLVCTKPISSTAIPSSFPLGIAWLPRREHFLVTVLLSSGELLAQNMTSIHLNNLIYMGDVESPPKLDPSVSFSVHMNHVLKRNINTPLIKSEDLNDGNKEGLLLVLLNATNIIRKEYLNRMDKASELITKRAKFLSSNKDLQFVELQKLETRSSEIATLIGQLTNKFKKTLDHQEELSKRVEKILDLLQSKMNHLSEAESSSQQELEEMNSSLETYKNKLDQIKKKIKYQQSIRTNNLKEEGNEKSLLSRQIASIKSVLASQSDAIQRLVDDVNVLKRHTSSNVS
ncbi:nuclear pore complex protein Nup88 [Brevipalpus obovatus]|uniref:nuclear pore complex protein Nup88 n=1 Tax=Brevipalpus obovatus TaxID=246614 RepID=UPI003D9E3392